MKYSNESERELNTNVILSELKKQKLLTPNEVNFNTEEKTLN